LQYAAKHTHRLTATAGFATLNTLNTLSLHCMLSSLISISIVQSTLFIQRVVDGEINGLLSRLWIAAGGGVTHHLHEDD
jgi:hypothetical protein